MGLYFNLSEEEREFAKQKTMFCLLIYDIRSNNVDLNSRNYLRVMA